MSFRVCVLGSGSAGNSILVCSKEAKILIDAGLSTGEIVSRLAMVATRPDELCAILISHEHIDHLRSAGVLARRYKLPLYLNTATFEAAKIQLGKVPRLEIFDPDRGFQLHDLLIEPFSVPHDAADPVSFCLYMKNRKLGIATDLGRPTTLVRQMLRACHALILESNHDPEMLLSGPYPWWLKQRIRGGFGHLSNESSQSLLRDVLHEELKTVILAHLSEKNNHVALAYQTAAQALQERGDLKNLNVALSIASQHQVGAMIDV
ncbi:MAG: MBL fold metallo-hydrolase [bacterium]|nr:MBL fold metallo-hydrolase [bacterium]